MTRPIGVGFLGAGPVTQAIHLPTLATMPTRFRVTRMMDVNQSVAALIAARCDAAASTAEHDVYDDANVEIVVVCSPNAFHAEQVIASCRAGKRLVLCEKPLAVSRNEAHEICRIATETKTPIIVGTMHAFDPAYVAAHAAWTEAGESASFVQSSIYLPSNDTFINQATDQVAARQPPQRTNGDDPASQSMMMRAAVLGLAIHDIPLIRALYPSVGELRYARFLPPFGYALSMTRAHQAADLLAFMPGQWPPRWNVLAIGGEHELRMTFPPSYVLAGSAHAELVGPKETRIFGNRHSGYEAMWDHIGDIVDGAAAPRIPLADIVADLCFALDLADGIDRIHSANS